MTLEEHRQKLRAAAESDYAQQSAINKKATDDYIAATNAAYAAAAKVNTDKVNSDIAALPGQYKAQYDSNNITEAVNRRKLAERMANLGLTDSGLNRTQDTAITLQRSNADAKLDRQQAAAADSLRQQLAEYNAKLEQEKAQKAAEANYNLSVLNQNLYNTLMQNADNNASSAYAAEQQAAAAAAAARASARSSGSSGSKTTSLKTPTEKMFDEALKQYTLGGESALAKYANKFPAYDIESLVAYAVQYGNRGKVGVTPNVGATKGSSNKSSSNKSSFKGSNNYKNRYRGAQEY